MRTSFLELEYYLQKVAAFPCDVLFPSSCVSILVYCGANFLSLVSSSHPPVPQRSSPFLSMALLPTPSSSPLRSNNSILRGRKEGRRTRTCPYGAYIYYERAVPTMCAFPPPPPRKRARMDFSFLHDVHWMPIIAYRTSSYL